MKVEKILISKIVIFYSMTGNTKAIAAEFEKSGFEVVNMKMVDTVNFDNYSTIVFGTSTWGRGIPPKPFFKIRDRLIGLENKKIGLFGSGRSEYQYYCGALDLLEEMLQDKNEIIFKYKYEGYPRDIDKENINKIILEEMK